MAQPYTYAPNSYYSAPEVYYNPGSFPLEVLPSRSPEVAYDPRAYPPEIASTNAPETSHDPQGFPPETAPNQYFEDKKNNIEPDSASFQNLVAGQEPKRESFFKRHWKLIAFLVGMIVIAGAAGGGVGGALASKSRSTPAVPKEPVEKPVENPLELPSSSLVTTGLPAGVPKLLQSTSVAAASCADGDRWVFMQDVSGNIRAAQYSSSNSSWQFAPEQQNFTAAKLGTSMGASCVNITEDVGLALGNYLSLVYVSTSDAIQQTVFSGGEWKDSPVRQGSKPPNEGSFLRISTYFRPISLQNEPVTKEANSSSEISPRSFTSVVTYQNKATLFMINLDSRASSNQGSRPNKNLLSNFDVAKDVGYDLNIGFACDYNLPIPANTSYYYSRCWMGNSYLLPTATAASQVRILNFIWEYPVSEAFERGNKTYDFVPNHNNLEDYGTQNIGTEIVLTPLEKNRSAVVFLTMEQKPFVTNIKSYFPPGEYGVDGATEPVWPKALPTTHFGATSQLSTVYVYYQVNATFISELRYDANRILWDEVPKFMSIT